MQHFGWGRASALPWFANSTRAVVLAAALWTPIQQAWALDLTRINQAIQQGRYGAVDTELQRLSAGASAADLVIIGKIERGLSSYRGSRQNGPDPDPSSRLPRFIPTPQPEPGGTPSPAPPAPVGPPPKRIIALGGYGTSWSAAVVNAQQTPYADQMVKFSPEWPAESIAEYKQAGFVVTDLSGGDRLSWAVVMSRYKDRAQPQQHIYGPGPIDDRVQDWIAKAMKGGYHITKVAGMGDKWVVVLTSGLRWGKQRFTLPGPYKYDWVQARLKEGCQITSAAGGRIVYPDNSVMETYMIVATQDTQWGGAGGWAQVPRDQFNDWFKQQRDAGTPTALIGLHNLPGAFFATGHPFGKGCGYILGARPEDFMPWVEKQRIYDKPAEPRWQTVEDLFRSR